MRSLLILTFCTLICVSYSLRVFVFETRSSNDASKGVKKNLVMYNTLLNKAITNRLNVHDSLVVLPEYGIVNDAFFDPTQQAGRSFGSFFKSIANFWKVMKQNKATSELCPTFEESMRDEEASDNQPLYARCLAAAFSCNIAANILTKDSGRTYNTEYLFNEKGNVAYSYFKRFPVPAETAQFRVFSGTSSGIVPASAWSGREKIGLLICFDILFPFAQDMARTDRVHTFIFSTEWSSSQELFSIAVQQAFSRVTKSILLASNMNGLDSSNLVITGSGIYRAGVALQYHVGDISGENSHSTSGRGKAIFLTEDIDLRPYDSSKDHFDDDDILSSLPDRQDNHQNTTVNYVAPGAVARTTRVVLEAGDVKCEWTLAGGETEAAPGLDKIGYVFRAQNGKYAGRRIRSCSMIAVADGNERNLKTWKKFNHKIPHKFESVELKSTVHGCVTRSGKKINVAALPIIQLMSSDHKPVPLLPLQSTFKLNGDKTTTLKALAAPGKVRIAIMSVYGVVGDAQDQSLLTPQERAELDEEVDVENTKIGDAMMQTVDTDAMENTYKFREILSENPRAKSF